MARLSCSFTRKFAVFSRKNGYYLKQSSFYCVFWQNTIKCVVLTTQASKKLNAFKSYTSLKWKFSKWPLTTSYFTRYIYLSGKLNLCPDLQNAEAKLYKYKLWTSLYVATQNFMLHFLVIFSIMHLIGLRTYEVSDFGATLKFWSAQYKKYTNRCAMTWKAQIWSQNWNISTHSREIFVFVRTNSRFLARYV